MVRSTDEYKLRLCVKLRPFSMRTLGRLVTSDRLINYPRTVITQRRASRENSNPLVVSPARDAPASFKTERIHRTKRATCERLRIGLTVTNSLQNIARRLFLPLCTQHVSTDCALFFMTCILCLRV